jgi:L-aminopeptidase/D-esterase-like protein
VDNLITDVAGLRVGQAEDPRLASGVSVVVFDEPAVASIAIGGGAPGLRDGALLEPGMAVDAVDALVLSGGSAFGLDAMGGVQALLRERGRGYSVGAVKVPIVPGAILFDLLNGGDKNWGLRPPYWDLGLAAARNAGRSFTLGSAGAGFGAMTANLKGGIGSASAETSGGFRVGALVAVNAVGQATIGTTPHFWAAPFERGDEFGGLGLPSPLPEDRFSLHLKGDADESRAGPAPENTTIAIVATDAGLAKPQAKRFALQALTGMALALRPAHAEADGDLVFAAATGRNRRPPSDRDRVEIGLIAGDCLCRAIARAIYAARALPFASSKPDWHQAFGFPRHPAEPSGQ